MIQNDKHTNYERNQHTFEMVDSYDKMTIYNGGKEIARIENK